jgi:gamma-glutamylcyclotransferase (GGCT)/AIG2-like uncharacterized protein YtfP
MMIFVYGTLKSDQWNNDYLEGADFITKHNLMGYKLFTNGIPFMVKTAIPDDRVAGEIWEVNEDTLEMLDRLEGHPNWYTREPVTAYDTTVVESYVYYGYISPRLEECAKENGVYVF